MELNRTSLKDQDAKITTGALADTLIDLIDLSLQGKQAHWNVIGPRFRSVHEALDELVDTTRGFADTVAERVVTLGEPALGLASHVDKQTKLDPFPSAFVGDDDTVEQIVERLKQVTGRVRERIELTSERDPASEDLLIEILRSLEEKMWMFHAQVQ